MKLSSAVLLTFFILLLKIALHLGTEGQKDRGKKTGTVGVGDRGTRGQGYRRTGRQMDRGTGRQADRRTEGHGYRETGGTV